ncbi:PhzF family phenazine biosynthesis protein [Actinomadura nitritigenes]|uniref:PhzF family phenazine biosynthesis protein n=1 Tax=Actinomadura nitritigenes TaxID=134602 RepID=A0ABS3QXP4_9ACTN|nr:PhzF family phenazine biosynthesis protein [Actinomadura nitritigenes]MBO2438527.1 PhzF family phenazine biosynthesis protein [Actinomadura nitritigenes]
MIKCWLVRAFVNAAGEHGNPALVVVEPEASSVTAGERQELATRLGVPATVFVVDAAAGRVSIHSNYGQSIRFGGHPLLATVEALHRIGRAPEELIPEAGPVPCRRDADGTVWLTAPARWSKPWRHYQMSSAAEIDALTGLPDGEDFTQVWAWEDQKAGRVRARLWAPRIGKGEDEACGSASMLLTQKLDRGLEVLHGRHRAVIRTRPVDDVRVELGGRCAVESPGSDVRAALDELYAMA